MYAAAQLGNFSSFLIHQSSRSTLAKPCDMTSCHMCLGLCCRFVVVSMETEHIILTLQWHNKRKMSIAGIA